MEEFGALFFVIILYFCVALPLRLARKTGGEKKKNAAKPRRPGFPAEAFSQEKDPGEPIPAEQQISGMEEIGPAAQDSVRTERIPFGGNEDLYRGSLNAVTGEGEDPCHVGYAAETHVEEDSHEDSGRVFTPGAVGDAIVMAEILKRPAERRRERPRYRYGKAANE